LLREDPSLAVTAIHDPDADAVFRKELAPAAALCGSVEALCGRGDVDWVFVGSFNCQHAAHAIAAFRAGQLMCSV